MSAGALADLGGHSDPEPWPQGISRAATMRISDVLRDLAPDFPSVSHSKLRFLEEQGLIDPVRTASGYRQYSAADVERLRYVLTQQRDHYLPLKVIKERLAELDAGTGAPVAPAPRLTGDTSTPAPPTVSTVAALAGADAAVVDALLEAGVLRPGHGGVLDAWSVDVVRIAAALSEHGIEARHLRSFRSAAERQVALVEQVVAPYRGQQSVAARAQAGSLAAEIGELLAHLHTAWLRQGVAEITP